MRQQLSKLGPSLVVLCALAFCSHVSAQIQNPIQAAKDAYNKAKQQKQPQPQPTLTASAAAPADPQGSPAAGGDCCTADAQKKLADSLGFVDIVGVKLGMTPAQVTAAFKANSPNLRVQLYNERMIMPTNPTGFVRVPRWMVAHDSPPSKDGSLEAIVVEFTTPPNPPVVERVLRRVQFATGKGVAVGNLVSAMQKKYGTETSTNSIYHYWVYQTSGQPLNRPLSGQALSCNNAGGGSDGSGFNPAPISDAPTTQDYGPPITLQNTENPLGQDNSDTGPACAGYVAIVGTVNTLNPGNVGDMTALSPSMVVTMQSAALVRNARISTHAWLQSDLDGKNKEQQDAGAARSAPKL